tara:strand:+ start:429 stop:620 length:192 start_codon:yes stop_codon:yes gene_type:complete
MNKELIELVCDLYFDYDRMSKSGQETLNKIAKMVKVPTNNKVTKEELIAMGCPKDKVHLYLEN